MEPILSPRAFVLVTLALPSFKDSKAVTHPPLVLAHVLVQGRVD